MNPWEDSSIEKPIAGLDKSQYGALEATPYHANINAGAAAFYRVEGGHKYEPDINYLHNGKYKDMKGDKNYYEM